MSYWSKLKKLLGQKQEGSEEKSPDIEFTPDELREMNDPATAVGRLLNPQRPLTKVEKDPLFNWGRLYSGAHELVSTGKYSTERSIEEKNAIKEARAAAAEAYLKDAEKRGIVSSFDDRITKNYKIINDLTQRKNLKDVKFKNEKLSDAYGEYESKDNAITLDPDKTNPFEYLKKGKLDKNAVSLAEVIAGALGDKKDSQIYPEMSTSKQKESQQEKLNNHLITTIHELRHAEDFKKDPEEKGHYGGHFFETPEYDWDETKSGRIHDVQSAALQRFSNMGRKKKLE